MNKLTERQIGYIAGILDGEGYITLRQEKYCYEPRLGVTNTNTSVLIWLRDVSGIGIVQCGTPFATNTKHKLGYRWIPRVPEIQEFLTLIHPSLIIKWDQAYLLLRYYENLTSNRGKNKSEDEQRMNKILFEEIRALNKRGRE